MVVVRSGIGDQMQRGTTRRFGRKNDAEFQHMIELCRGNLVSFWFKTTSTSESGCISLFSVILHIVFQRSMRRTRLEEGRKVLRKNEEISED